MNIKKTLILIVVLVSIFLGALYFSKEPASIQNNATNVVQDTGKEVLYVDNQNNQQLKVVYYENNTAAIYAGDVNEVTFTATTSASGARYENAEQGLILWNKGNEVSLYLNDSLIFSGIVPEELPEEVQEVKTDLQNFTDIKWIWKKTTLNDGTVVIPKKVDVFSITFKEDNTVSGTTDCNNFSGTYAVNDSALMFGPMMSTLMGCLDSQETEFNQTLNQVNGYELSEDGAQLLLKLGANKGIIIFEK